MKPIARYDFRRNRIVVSLLIAFAARRSRFHKDAFFGETRTHVFMRIELVFGIEFKYEFHPRRIALSPYIAFEARPARFHDDKEETTRIDVFKRIEIHFAVIGDLSVCLCA